MKLAQLKQQRGFNVMNRSQLERIMAGVRPDCEGGKMIDGVLYCDHYEDTGNSGGDVGNNTNSEDCLMGF